MACLASPSRLMGWILHPGVRPRLAISRPWGSVTSAPTMAEPAVKFAAFTDEYLRPLGLDPARVRLDRDEIDLVEVIYAWDEATI
jgi:hypothetical protein